MEVETEVMWLQAKECRSVRSHQELGRGKEGSLVGWPCQNLDFNIQLQNCERIISPVGSHRVCGNLLGQP